MGDRGRRGRPALSATDPSLSGADRGSDLWSSWRTAWFGDAGSRPNPLLAVWVALLSAGFVYARGGLRPQDATFWAEDGFVFVHDSLQLPHRFLLFEPAVGYLNVLPRALGAICALFPLDQLAFVMAVLTSLVQGALCAVAFEVMRSRTSTLWPAIVVALAVALPPVGTETIRNAANLQWYLMSVTILTVFWTPRGRTGAGIRLGLVALTATSSPFGFVVLALLAARWVVRRTWTDAVTAAVALVLVPIQLHTLLTAGQNRELRAPARQMEIAAGYLRRVVGDGILGIGRQTPTQSSPEIASGVVVAVILVVAMAVLACTAYRMGLLFPLSLIAVSLGLYWMLLRLNGLPTDDPFAGQRYAVPPALLLLTAVTDVAWLSGHSVGSLGRGPRLLLRVARIPAFTVLGLALFGIVSTVASYNFMRSGPSPGWPAQMVTAAATCRTPVASAEVAIEPPSIVVSLPCYLFDPSRLSLP